MITARHAVSIALGLLGLAAVPLLAACERDASPQLITVLDLAPREAEVGDRLELTGSGFPQGRAAHVTFHGTLNRPGEAPVLGADIPLEGVVTSAQVIELVYGEPLEAVFCRAGEDAVHTTFEGEVEVAFSAAAAGAPPIVATLRDVTLDLRPPAPRRGIAEARAHEGERALAYAGIHLGERTSSSGGLLVAEIEPGSRAETAGILPGDLVVSFDHVRVGSVADVIPAPRHPMVAVGIRRGTSAREEIREIKMDGYRPPPPSDLLAAALVLGVATALLLLFTAPRGAWLAWLGRRFAASHQVESAASSVPRIGPTVSRILFAAVTLLWAAVPIAMHPLVRELDAGVPFAFAVTSLALVACASARGFRAKIAAAVRVVSLDAPAAIALVAVVVMTGSVRLHEVVRAQGALPWEWFVFKTPMAFLAFVTFLIVLVVQGLPEATSLGEHGALGLAAATKPVADDDARPFARAIADWVHLAVLSGLAAAAFLGGWQIPGLAPGEATALAWRLVGAVLLVAKTLAVMALLVRTRRALPGMTSRAVIGLAWRVLVPLAVLSLLLTLAWEAARPDRLVQILVSTVLSALVAVAVTYTIDRLRRRSTTAQAQLDPFL
jgi:NADH-quinone oxidoreductase subunit H